MEPYRRFPVVANPPVVGRRRARRRGSLIMLVGSLQSRDRMTIPEQPRCQTQHALGVGTISVKRKHQHTMLVHMLRHMQQIPAVQLYGEAMDLGTLKFHRFSDNKPRPF